MRRVVALVLAVGAALLLGAAPAWAHSQLDASNPADGASVATPPPAVSLTFNEDVQAGFTVITLIGPDGKDYHTRQRDRDRPDGHGRRAAARARRASTRSATGWCPPTGIRCRARRRSR